MNDVFLGHGTDTHPHQATADDNGLGTILFLSATFLIGALCRHLINKFCPAVPYTVSLLAIGLLIGILFKEYENILIDYLGMLHLDPHLLMYVFLPVLLFESAFLLDIHALKKSLLQVLILALPGYLCTAVLTAVVVYFIFVGYNWSWNGSMMLGAILSATDPVAVVALLKSSPGGKDVHHLSIVIEGESLLNDGAAIVLFNIFQSNAMSPCPDTNYTCYIDSTLETFPSENFCDNYTRCDSKESLNKQMCSSLTSKEIIIDITLKTIVGPLFGAVAGFFVISWLAKVFNDSLTEITITVGSPYLVYFISEMYMKSSGVLSVVTFGVVVNLNKMSISPEIEHFLNKFWEQMGYIVNTLLFLVVGMLITFLSLESIEPIDVLYLFLLYLGMTMARVIMLVCFQPLLQRVGYGSTWKSLTVLGWGALRGAVSLALALQVQYNIGFCKKMRSRVLFLVSGIVVLTLLINSTTFNKVLNLLGFCRISKAKKCAVDLAAERIQDSMAEELNNVKCDHFLSDSHWGKVEEMCRIDTIYNTEQELPEQKSHIVKLHDEITARENCDHSVPVRLTKVELSDYYDELRLSVLKGIKIKLWKLFDSGLLNKPALKYLDDVCDETMDEKDKFIQIEDLEKKWQIGPVLQFIKRKLETWQKGRDGKQTEHPIPNNIYQYNIYKFVSTQLFELFIMFLIFLNTAAVITEMSMNSEECSPVEFTYNYINYAFLTLFVCEMFLKLIGQRKYYFYGKWNLLDFAIILISIVDVVIGAFLDCTNVDINFTIVRLVRIIRLFRCVRLFKFILLLAHKVVKKLINRSLSHGYAIGAGFVVASEEAIRQLDQLISHKECRLIFREKLNKARADTVNSLGALRKEYPGISVAIKTKQAMRTVLNKARETAWKLLDDGHIDDFDADLFVKQIEMKMKRLQANFDVYLPPPGPFGLFSEVPWLRQLRDDILIELVKHVRLEVFNEGDIFMEKGKVAPGIFLIISGLAKVTSHEDKLHETTSKLSFLTHGDNAASDSEFLSIGCCVGELSILINKPRGSFVICETEVQVYFIPAEDMHGLMLKFPIIEERLWRYRSVRIAISHLAKLEKYKTKTMDEMELLCEKSVLATLVPDTNNGVFDIDDFISDVLVIYGEATCFPSNNHIVGPKVVTEGSTKLHLLVPCKLLIIVKNKCDVDLKDYNEDSIPGEHETVQPDISRNTSNLLIDGVKSLKSSEIGTNEFKLSILNKAANPKCTEEYERKIRRSYMEDAVNSGIGDQEPSYFAQGTDLDLRVGDLNQSPDHGPIIRVTSDQRMAPVEEVVIVKRDSLVPLQKDDV